VVTEAQKVQAEYVREIKEELNQKFPGLAFDGSGKLHMVYEIEQEFVSLTVDSKDNPEEAALILRIPFVIDQDDSQMDVVMAHPRSKEEIFDHVKSTLRKWIDHNRTQAQEMLTLFDAWEKHL